MKIVQSCPFMLSESSSRILWEITSRCNMKCKHCLYFNDRKNEDLCYSEMLKILDSIKEDGKIKSVWLSGGEPLMRGEIFDFIKEISKRNLIPSISTNGTLITKEVASRLYEVGIRYAHLSIDGVTADVHDKLRQVPGAFDMVMEGIEHLKNSNISVGASYMITWDSVVQVPDMIQLAKKKGLDVLSFYLVAPLGRGAKMVMNDEMELMERLNEALLSYENEKVKLEVFRTLSKEQCHNSEAGLMECECQYFYTISNDGYLSGCPWFSKAETSIRPISLKEFGFLEASIILHRELEQFKNNRREMLEDKCKKCIHNSNCGKGCLAVCDSSGRDLLCNYLYN